jgi:hypothetical protein
LKHAPNALHFLLTSDSYKYTWDLDFVEFKFVSLLVCNNEKCKEPITVSGTGFYERIQTSATETEHVEFFRPTHVNPSPALIPISPKYPKKVVSELEKSFISSWQDYSASGNHIRAAVERLLDHLKQPKTQRNNSGKQQRIVLHKRITELAKRKKDVGEALLAVKWLGNAGSHTDELTQNDVYDALDILDSVLEELFVQQKTKVKKLVAAINKRKGPAKKKL